MKLGNKRDGAEVPRYNTALLMLMLLCVPLYGGFHTGHALLAGVILALLLAFRVHSAGKLLLPTGPKAFCLYGLFLCQLLTLPFAVNPGMAFTGALLWGVWLLFFLCCFTYTPAERRIMLDSLADEGALLSALFTLLFLGQRLAGVPDANGRLDGPFEYANTWALYQLVCIVLLLGRERRRKWDFPAVGVLLPGILLSGSRGVLLLTFPAAALWGLSRLCRFRGKLPRWTLPTAAGGAVLAAAALLGSGLLPRLGSLLSLGDSYSLNGRLLYWKDALRMLSRRPLGLGRGGYYYLQTLEQTGIYTVRHAHNEYIQAALEGGVLCGVLLLGLLLCFFLFRRDVPVREGAAVCLIGLHALVDFDLQYPAVAFLLLLCLSGGRRRELSLSGLRKKAAAGALALSALLLGYFSLAYTLDFLGRPVLASRMFPAGLELAEHALSALGETPAGEAEALRITEMTDLSMLAWDSLNAAAARRADKPGMAEAGFQYLRLNRYRGEVYEEFAEVLKNVYASCTAAEWERCRPLARAAAELLRDTRDRTDPLAYRLSIVPNFDFAALVSQRLDALYARPNPGE